MGAVVTKFFACEAHRWASGRKAHSLFEACGEVAVKWCVTHAESFYACAVHVPKGAVSRPASTFTGRGVAA